MQRLELMRFMIACACFPGALAARAFSRSERGQQYIDTFTDHLRWYAWPVKALYAALAGVLILASLYWLSCVPFLGFDAFAHPAHALRIVGLHLPWWLLSCALAFVYEFLHLAFSFHHSGEGRARAAGQRAEQGVRRVVRQLAKDLHAVDLHGALLIAKRGTDAEFSMEIDHLLVTRHNVFVIETKYKAGAVHVDEDAAVWQVHTPRGQTTMRNALRQVKNTARQLQQHFQTGVTPIPVVVIASENGTTIYSDVSNVVTPDRLALVVSAFEREAAHRAIDREALLARIHAATDNSMRARRAHNARANAAKQRHEEDTIRSRASL